MQIAVLGLSHKTASLKVRERIHIPVEENRTVLRKLKNLVPEAMILSTCNRFEILCGDENQNPDQKKLVQFIAEQCRIPRSDFESSLYFKTGLDAVRHVFRVAGSLDSMVVGEAQILGQMKQSFSLAHQEGTVHRLLHSLLERAFSVAKKIRTTTLLASHPVSVSSVAVELAIGVFGDLSSKTAFMIGAGKMSLLAIRHLRSRGIADILVANRTFSKARETADRIQGRAVSIDNLRDWLPRADIVISSTGCPHLMLHQDEIRAAMVQRKNRPMLLIDIAVPRDIDPDAHDISNVFLYDIDNLQTIADRNSSERMKEAAKAQSITDREAAQHWRKLNALDVTPTIRQIREKVEDICREELESGLRKLGDFSQEQKLEVERLAAGLVDKIVQGPFCELRHLASDPDARDKIRYVRSLFLA